MKTFEIYFSNLNKETQQELLDFVGAEKPSDMNWDIDILPIATFDVEENPDGDESKIEE